MPFMRMVDIETKPEFKLAGEKGVSWVGLGRGETAPGETLAISFSRNSIPSGVSG